MPHVPLADHAGFVTGIFQHLGNRDLALRQATGGIGKQHHPLTRCHARTHRQPTGHQGCAAGRADRRGGIELSPLLPLMRHAIKVRRVNGRMTVARHIAVPLVIGENHNEVQLLLGQSRRTQTKRHAQTKRTQFQIVQKKGVHAEQPTTRPVPLEEKETRRSHSRQLQKLSSLNSRFCFSASRLRNSSWPLLGCLLYAMG